MSSAQVGSPGLGGPEAQPLDQPASESIMFMNTGAAASPTRLHDTAKTAAPRRQAHGPGSRARRLAGYNVK